MNYSTILIEIFTSTFAVLLLVLGLILPKGKKNIIGYTSTIGLVCILIFSFLYYQGNTLSFYKGLYVSDNVSVFFKQVFLISAILVTIISLNYTSKFADSSNEFFTIIIFALLGMMVLSSANDLITLYIGLELMSISFIILTAFDRTNIKSTEAGTKYVLLSAMSSAVLLYGMSMLYGVSGSVTFPDIISFLKTGHSQPLVILACIMIIAGFAFKISAVPFHMWSPDIYEGAPTPVTAFLAGGSNVAGFSVLIRLLMQLMDASFGNIVILIVCLSVLSMIIGNIIAIPQTNIKRMLAYSGIAHAGYILLGLVVHTKMGISAMMYYLMLYVFANIGAFSSVIAFSSVSGKEDIKDFGGMWKRSPFLAATLMISLLSLAGIPPAAGFIGKFYLLSEVVKSGNLWIAFLTMGMSVVSIYYYISVIKILVIGEATDNSPIKIPLSLKAGMAISMAATLIMGVYPGPITNWTTTVANIFMK